MEDKITRKITQDDFVTEKVDIIKNNLLGSYNENNEYHIAAPIIDELIAIEKLRKTSFGNSVFCVGNLLGYGEIVFEILYNTKTDNNSAQAYLFVLEDVNKINGYLQNTIRTQIAHFTGEVENFIEQSYEKFNVIGTLGDDGMEKKDLDNINLDDSYILAKKAYSLLLDKLCDEKMLDCYGNYFTARLTALTKMDNDFTNSVLGRFNEEYALIQGVFLQNKNYRTLNELLDKCIEETSGTKPEFVALEEDFNNAIKLDLDKFIHSMSSLNEKSKSKAINLLDKADRSKIEEIQSQAVRSEKDLSSDDALEQFGESNAEAPRQTFESIEMEVKDLFNKVPVAPVQEEVESLEGQEVVEELHPIEETEEMVEDAILEESNEDVSELDSEDIASFFENKEIPTEEINDVVEDSAKEEEMSPEEEQEIASLFAEESELEIKADEDLFNQLGDTFAEGSTYNELDDESDALDKEIEQITEGVKNQQQEIVQPQQSIQAENMTVQDFFNVSNPNHEVVSEVEDVSEHDEHIDSLNNDYKENASMSIFERLNRLNKNAKTDSQTKTTSSRPLKGDDKLDRLYDLLDKPMDR